MTTTVNIKDGDRVIGYFSFIEDEKYPHLIEVHNEMYEWSVSIYKKMLVLWEQLMLEFKAKGIQKVLSSVSIEADDLVLKYLQLAGFTVVPMTIGQCDIWAAERNL